MRNFNMTLVAGAGVETVNNEMLQWARDNHQEVLAFARVHSSELSPAQRQLCIAAAKQNGIRLAKEREEAEKSFHETQVEYLKEHGLTQDEAEEEIRLNNLQKQIADGYGKSKRCRFSKRPHYSKNSVL
jgi:hypothetical protein